MSFRKVVTGEVRFSIQADAPCPCGSSTAASKCCLTEHGFRKTPAATAPAPPTTGYSHAACYAGPLADCSARRSREHYVSESLLTHLHSHNELTVTGFPWVPHGEKVVSPSALASKILCQRHNSALSPLDAIAVHLFQAFDEEGASGVSVRHKHSGREG